MSSGAEPSPSDPDDAAGDEVERSAARKGEDDAWAATGLLISGVVVWGGAGYLLSEKFDAPVFTMVGLLLGTATALYGIWFRYGRS